MRSFKIPVGLSHYTVKIRKRVIWKGTECEGFCDPEKKEILIAKADPDVMILAFWHEYGHALFCELGDTERAYNEAFIESFGQNVARAVRSLPSEFK